MHWPLKVLTGEHRKKKEKKALYFCCCWQMCHIILLMAAAVLLKEFERSRQNMIERAHSWVNKMANAKQTIAKFAEPFIPNGTVSLLR